MTRWNAITVQTDDHGPVTVQCPDWCTGDGHPDGITRADISHYGPDLVISVPTPAGPVELFTLGLVQYQFTDLPIGTAVHAAVSFADTAGWPTDPDDFERLAAGIAEAVATARREVQRLHVQAGGAA